MATVTMSKRADGIVNVATGSFTGDGAAQTLTLGFVPLQVTVMNETDAILWQKFDPMAAANSIKTDTAVALDTGSAIVINTDGTVTLSSGLCVNAKAIKFIARR